MGKVARENGIVVATAADMKALKKRHGLTTARLASVIYGMKVRTMENYVSGTYPVPPWIWWILRMLLDGIDIARPKSGEAETVKDVFKADIAVQRRTLTWPDDDAIERKYLFDVAVVSDGTIGAHGRYYRAKDRPDKHDAPIVILETPDQKTIRHEAIHATVDFIRSIGMSFDELFDPKKGTAGEEIFAHYHGHFCDEIADAVLGVG